MKVLVIVAHPDDEVLGMGGTILRHVEKKDTVKVVILATGIMSRKKSGYKNNPDYDITKEDKEKMKKEIEILRKDARRSAKILKIQDISFYDYPDNEMDSVPLLKIIKTIEKEISEFKPDLVYTHHYGDLNIDHRIVYQATITSCRPIGNKIQKIISFEVPSSTEWNYPNSFNPNYFVSIEPYLKKKINAMEAYTSEIKKFPHPRSSKYLETLASKWGAVLGIKSVEAFEIIRIIER